MSRWILFLILLFLVLVFLGACAERSIPRVEACHEQAEAWCERAGFAGPGCPVWYQHECSMSDPDGAVDGDDQAMCLEAIAVNPRPDVEPTVCVATWSTR